MTRKVNVIDAREVNSGTSANGRDWHLYEIVATTPEGEPIDLKLKSFEKLDGLVEVEVEKQEHEKYGTSYLLKRPGQGGAGGGGSPGARLGPKVDELRGRVERLEGIVEAMRTEITGLKTAVGRAPDSQPAAATSGSRFASDDDIPF